MKTTLFFKQADAVLQLLSLLIPACMALVTADGGYFIGAYLAVGSTQVLSCIINALLLNSDYAESSRPKYAYTLLAMAIIGSVCVMVPSFNELGYLGMVTLLFVSPFLALWYFRITYREMQHIAAQVKRKEFAQR